MAKRAARKRAVKNNLARTPPYEPYPEWSTARFWGFVRSGLRAKANRWPPKFLVLKEAKRDYQGDNKRLKFEYLCAICQQYHPQKEIEVDHIVPCGKLSSFEDLPGFVERLFCGKEGLRVVCKSCHKELTRAERT